MNELDGKVVVITGGFGNLGRVTAQVIAALGAKVALIAHGAAADAQSLSLDPASTIVTGGVDLGDATAAQRAIDTIAAKWGRLDGLVNIAGGFRWETVADGSIETWDQMYGMNVRTAFNASKAAIAHLVVSGAGRIVNIGAGAAMKAGAGMGAYGASKAGVLRLTEALAEELKDLYVTVNAIMPSIIDTPQNRADMPNADVTRWVKAEEVAAVIAFLLSAQAQAVTGAAIPVTGRV